MSAPPAAFGDLPAEVVLRIAAAASVSTLTALGASCRALRALLDPRASADGGRALVGALAREERVVELLRVGEKKSVVGAESLVPGALARVRRFPRTPRELENLRALVAQGKRGLFFSSVHLLTRLKALELGGVQINEEDVGDLQTHTQPSDVLETLHLSLVPLPFNSTVVHELGSVVRLFTRLRHISITISHNGAFLEVDYLLESLGQLRKLETINIGGVERGLESNLPALFTFRSDSAVSPELRELIVKTRGGATLATRWLVSTPDLSNLRTIRIRDTALSMEGVRRLADVTRRSPNLEVFEFDVEAQPYLNDYEIVRTLFSGMSRSCPQLRQLSLVGLAIEIASASHLASALHHWPRLAVVHLKRNKHSSNCAPVIAAALLHTPELEEFEMETFDATNVALPALVATLLQLPRLRRVVITGLDFPCAQVSDARAQLAAAFPRAYVEINA
jgi:hypothetical protein